MADNLEASIRIDTKKLTADAALAKQQLTQAGKDFQRALNSGANRAQIDQLSGAYDTLRKQAITTSRAASAGYAAYSKAADAAARSTIGLSKAHRGLEESSRGAMREVFKLSREFGNLEVSALNIAKAFKEFPRVAIPVAVAGAAATAAYKLADAAARNVTELDELSKASGFAGKDIVALEKVFRGQNVEVTSLDAALKKAGESFDKYKAKAANLGALGGGGVAVLKGGQPSGESGGVMVFRGGQALPSQFGPEGTTVLRGGRPFDIKPEEGLAGIVSPQMFKADAEGRRKWLEEAIKTLVNIQKTEPSLAIEVARAEWGDQAEKIIRGFRESMRPGAMSEALRGTAGDPRLREQAIRQSEDLQRSQKEFAAETARTGTIQGLQDMQAVNKTVDAAAEGAKAAGDALEQAATHWQNATKEITQDWDRLKANAELGIDAGASASTFQNTWTGAFDAISKTWSSTVQSIESTTPAGMGASPAPGGAMTLPYASGGTVPGTGNGDTVPAMLTPGEFVNRKSSVGYYGAGLFRALNSMRIPRDAFRGYGYALGGLVDSFHASPQHFATGGIVESGGGRTNVHLHLGNEAFGPLVGEDVVVNRLMSASKKQQMRSAGRKPSWVS